MSAQINYSIENMTNVILTTFLIAAVLFLYCALSGGNKDKEQ